MINYLTYRLDTGTIFNFGMSQPLNDEVLRSTLPPNMGLYVFDPPVVSSTLDSCYIYDNDGIPALVPYETMTPVMDKTVVATVGDDFITISNIPPNSSILIYAPTEESYVVEVGEDGIAEIQVDFQGKYTYTIRKMNYFDFNGEFNAN